MTSLPAPAGGRTRGISVLTPTGGRPEGLALLEGFLNRQTFRDFEWIVVDDADPTYQPQGPHVCYYRPPPRPGENTQARNMAVALELACCDRVAIMEDDDWYHPEYLARINAWLDDADLVGESGSRYYNVRTRTYRLNGNNKHASLCSTACKGAARERLREIVTTSPKFIDIELWRSDLRKRLYPFEGLSIGMKGLPGRGGIGIGHQRMKDTDPDGRVLRGWIGADAELYEAL